MRIFAISDLHIDFKPNQTWVHDLSGAAYRDDVLILAGDVSSRIDRLAEALAQLARKFARVFFVPGNHDLWVQRGEASHSLEKFHRVLDVCAESGVTTQAEDLGDVCVVPLFSWYRKPEEGADSLFAPKRGEDPSLRMWSDNALIRWPDDGGSMADYFLLWNTSRLAVADGKPAISFSHFLPRQELMFSSAAERRRVAPGASDPHPAFNFSRVAGTSRLDRQIRRIGAVLHVYGHQHRNRCRTIDGVTYVSHCLGYHRERQAGLACRLDEGPRLIWPTGLSM